MAKILSRAISISIIGNNTSETWPLTISSNGRYLQYSNGVPFVVIGDSPWSLSVNCSDAQIMTYLNDRTAKGCTAILFEAIEKAYSNQTPAYKNVDGVAPFTNMSPINWVLNDTYWRRVDLIVNECKSRGIACFITPAYTGYGNGSDGWLNEYSSSTNAALQAYGAALATRYNQGNVVWVMGGDDANDFGVVGNYGSTATPNRTKQWQIALGIRSVRTTDLITGHTARNGHNAVDGESYKAWTTGYTGWNLNNIYAHDNNDDAVALATTAYSRSGPIPFFLIEAGYENIDGNNSGGRYPAIQSFLSGGLGGFFGGHDVIWHMGSYSPDNYGAGTALSRYLAGSWTDYKNFASLIKNYSWHKLEPQKNTTLVTTALGTLAESICPSLASDKSFAFIFCPSAKTFSVNMAALGPISLRARWYDVTTGVYTTVTGGPFSNSGVKSFTSPGERILVIDAA